MPQLLEATDSAWIEIADGTSEVDVQLIGVGTIWIVEAADASALVDDAAPPSGMTWWVYEYAPNTLFGSIGLAGSGSKWFAQAKTRDPVSLNITERD